MSNVTITTPSRQLTNAEAIAKFRASKDPSVVRANLDDMLYGWQLPTKADWDALEGVDRSHARADEDLVLYPNTMTWTVE